MGRAKVQELNELISELGHPVVDETLESALERALEEKEQILPVLYEQYKTVLSTQSSEAVCQRPDLLVALLLLGKWEETNSAELVCQFITHAAPILLDHLDGAILGLLDVIVANTCSKRIDLLKRLLENNSIAWGVRANVIDSLLILFARSSISRNELLVIFKKLLKFRGEEDCFYWENLIRATIAVYPDDEARLLIKQAIDDGVTVAGLEEDEIMFADYKEFHDVENELSDFSSLEESLEVMKDFYDSEIGDCFEEIQSCDFENIDEDDYLFDEDNDDFDENEEELSSDDDEPIDFSDSEERETFEKELQSKGGDLYPERNEPCFCGSDKKYKKCCEPQELQRKANSLRLINYEKVEFGVLDDPTIVETMASWEAKVQELDKENKSQEIAQYFNNCQLLTDLYPGCQTFDALMACLFHNIWLVHSLSCCDFLGVEMHYMILNSLVEDFEFDAPIDLEYLKKMIDMMRIERRIAVLSMRSAG